MQERNGGKDDSRKKRSTGSDGNTANDRRDALVAGINDMYYRYTPIEEFPLGIDGFFVFVFKSSARHNDMFNVDAIHDICDVIKHVILPMFKEGSELELNHSVSIIELIQLHARDTPYPCKDITQQDIDNFRLDLFACKDILIPSKANNATVPGSTTTRKPESQCKVQWTILFSNAANYFINQDFLQGTDPAGKISYSNALIFTWSPLFGFNRGPLGKEQTELYLDYVEDKKIESGSVQLTAVKFPMGEDLKFELFQKYVLSDIWWFALALALVIVVMIIYMLRIDLVLATLISIVSGFMLAYATYFAVFGMKFFPFINILGLLILIAIGADDVFVFFDIFEQVRSANPNLRLSRIMAKTLNHAVSSIFVTSFTTASAFFANAVSNITSVRNFGLFAGTAVILNFFVMVLVVPSVIVISEVILECLNVKKLRQRLSNMTGKLPRFICGRERNLPARMLRYTWIIWLVLLSLVGLAGCFVVFINPRFQLPITKDFQLFPSSNYVENWYLNIRSHFKFANDENSQDYVNFFYIWGFDKDDPGNHFDPDDKEGPLKLDKKFDFYHAKTQVWLRDYCLKTREAKFAEPYYNTSYICLLEAYEEVASKLCDTSHPSLSRFVNFAFPQCCESKTIPFGRDQLQVCAPLYQAIYENTVDIPIQLDFSFNKHIFDAVIYDVTDDVETTNRIRAYVIPVATTYIATFEYDIMDGYYQELAQSFIDDLAKAPKNVQDGFCAFTDWFWFYDLQHSLATGTYYSIGLSLLVAFIVMFVTSLNVVITIYAMVTITFAITSTVAVLVLMGWYLNVIESIIISLSVGMSIDFAIHYGVAYRLSKETTCRARTAESYERVGPAVAMAAVTTFLAGAAMMPCHVLAYTKLGIFLMLVMTFAWIYSTFFFQSLCWFIGPIGQCCVVSPNFSLKRIAQALFAPVQSSDVGRSTANTDSDRDDTLLGTFGAL